MQTYQIMLIREKSIESFREAVGSVARERKYLAFLDAPIELTVREHNKPTIALYEKLGFKVEGLHRNSVRIDGEYENYIVWLCCSNVSNELL